MKITIGTLFFFLNILLKIVMSIKINLILKFYIHTNDVPF